MSFIKQRMLLFVIFITGACVLILEVVAVRILSPYFGNTIYSYSSILSVILGALSFGYYFGGRYADKNPYSKNFFAIIFLSGFTVLVMELCIVTLVPKFAYNLPFTTGPLILSSILFALPSFLLGTLSPYAIKLQEKSYPKDGTGKLTGEVFFASTIGSIFGSLLTGFFFIPYFGIKSIVIGTGVTLLALGRVGLWNIDSKKKVYSIIFLSICCFATVQSVTKMKGDGVVFAEDGVYEQLLVYDTQLRNREARVLLQDRSAASAIEKETGKPIFEYAPYYQLYTLMKDPPQNALFVGTGAYTFPKALHEKLPDTQIDMVDIEPKLEGIAKKYFGLQESPQFKNYIQDGRRFIHDTENVYDYMYVDVYKTIYAIPSQFTSKEFFELTKSKLNENGIILMNIIGSLKDEPNSIALSELKTFREVYPNSYFFAVDSPNSKDTQNMVFIGINSEETIDIAQKTVPDDITGESISLMAHQIDITKIDFSKHTLFTDNYAPVEKYSSHLLDIKENKSDGEKESPDDKAALELIKEQVAFGPRYLGSIGHTKVVDWLENKLRTVSETNTKKQSWEQKGIKGEYDLTNLIFRINPEKTKRVIVGTHFDTLKKSVDTGAPIPGANNGGSGTAVMLSAIEELVKNRSDIKVGVDFVFFDAEEGDPEIPPGSSPDWSPWGSVYFGGHLADLYKNQKPDHMVNLDLVCSKNAQFFYETNSLYSANSLTQKFWEIGGQVDKDMFVPKSKYTILDDHTVLQKAGIPSFLVIDFDYPELHSTTDTIDKCSGETLGKVKETLLEYLYTI